MPVSGLSVHALGRADAEQRQRIADDLARRGQQCEAGARQLGVVDQEALGGVVAVEGRREVAQVERDLVRRQVRGGGGEHRGSRRAFCSSAVSLGAASSARSAAASVGDVAALRRVNARITEQIRACAYWT